MAYKSIQNSTVLVRVDMDIKGDPMLEQNKPRTKSNIETIKALLDNGNKVVLCGKRGRPKGETVPELSTRPVMDAIEDELKKAGVETELLHLDQFASFEQTKWKIENTEAKVIVLENTRFHPDEQSKNVKKQKILAAQYATLAEFFVHEGFAVSHRKNATTYHIKDFLPTMLGLSHQKEIAVLRKLRSAPEEPYYFIMGGAKLKTKLPLVKKVLLVADKVFLGGLISLTFVQAAKELGMEEYKNIEIHESYVETGFLDDAKELLKRYPEKLVLPVDYITDEDKELGKYCADVGPKTMEVFEKELPNAKTVFWNGPLGRYEKPPFDASTDQLATLIAGLKNTYTVVGGGDSVSALPEGAIDQYSFVSMGGGASLDLLGR